MSSTRTDIERLHDGLAEELENVVADPDALLSGMRTRMRRRRTVRVGVALAAVSATGGSGAARNPSVTAYSVASTRADTPHATIGGYTVDYLPPGMTKYGPRGRDAMSRFRSVSQGFYDRRDGTTRVENCTATVTAWCNPANNAIDVGVTRNPETKTLDDYQRYMWLGKTRPVTVGPHPGLAGNVRSDGAKSVTWMARRGVVISVHASDNVSDEEIRAVIAGIHPKR